MLHHDKAQAIGENIVHNIGRKYNIHDINYNSFETMTTMFNECYGFKTKIFLIAILKIILYYND